MCVGMYGSTFKCGYAYACHRPQVEVRGEPVKHGSLLSYSIPGPGLSCSSRQA